MQPASILTATVTGAFLALLSSCALEPIPTPHPAPGPGAPGDTDPTTRTGAELYGEKCAGCHGADGAGSMAAPQIQSPVVGYARYVARSGRDEMPFDLAMPAFDAAALPDAELGAVLEHLRSIPHPEDGAGLFQRFCANCHGADAQGGRVGVDLTHEVQEEPEEFLEMVREGSGGTDYGDRSEYMPAWPAEELTNADVDLIVAYLQGLPLGPGEEEEDEEEDEEEEEE